MEIKFRAWDKKTLAMGFVHSINFETDKQLSEAGDVIIHFPTDNPAAFIQKIRNILRDEVVLLQFTGLHDKNGKEIFEGDILATSNSDESLEIDLWNKEDFGYTVVEWRNKFSGFTGTKWVWDNTNQPSVYAIEFCEVIGNIYENPELLK